MSSEPDVPVPMPRYYGAPYCPSCGYKCGCCCKCKCQTPCPGPNEDLDIEGEEWCSHDCHGGHEPWDCEDWSTRYIWAKAKSESERLASQ